MKKYTVTMGIEKDKNGQELSKSVDVSFNLELVEIFITRRYGGFTKTEHVGGYKHENGRTVREKSVCYSVLDVNKIGEVNLLEIAKKAKQWLKQESFLFTLEDVQAEFI